MSAEAFDLDKLAKLLGTDRRYADHVRIIEEFGSASSILQDLKTALGSLDTLSQISGDAGARGALGQPLMMHAVITYSRALISRTNNRRTMDVVKKAYTPEQRKKHDGIADLRSTALAHYHVPLGIYAAEWVDDRAVAVIDGEHCRPTDVYTRYNFTKLAAEDLYELLSVAIAYVSFERERRAEEVRKMLLANKADAVFRQKLNAAPFDPENYFKSHVEVEAFWAQIDTRAEHFIPRS